MCDTCGCNLTEGNRDLAEQANVHGHTAVNVLSDLMSANDRQAEHNRNHLESHGVFAVNLMSSPGAGKTALLEATIAALAPELRIAVIEGDLETENDAARIRQHGVPAVQITTGSACHLDAFLVHDALHQLDMDAVDLLFIENVGNLVCPASFDLGQHRNVALLSVTEGEDKPAKYPVVFRAADAVVISKVDLIELIDDFDPQIAAGYIRALGRDIPLLQTAARKRLAIDSWLEWLRHEVAGHRERRGHFKPVPGNAARIQI